MMVMLNHAERIAKAVAMEERAEQLAGSRDECLQMAQYWRYLAVQAQWRDWYGAELAN
jgi:hypothetical protein